MVEILGAVRQVGDPRAGEGPRRRGTFSNEPCSGRSSRGRALQVLPARAQTSAQDVNPLNPRPWPTQWAGRTTRRGRSRPRRDSIQSGRQWARWATYRDVPSGVGGCEPMRDRDRCNAAKVWRSRTVMTRPGSRRDALPRTCSQARTCVPYRRGPAAGHARARARPATRGGRAGGRIETSQLEGGGDPETRAPSRATVGGCSPEMAQVPARRQARPNRTAGRRAGADRERLIAPARAEGFTRGDGREAQREPGQQ